MNEEEKQPHSLIRAITVHTFRPLNQSLLEWLRADCFFRAAPPSHRHWGRRALFLADLEAHLVVWFAKYEAWIPNQPEHAVVFLADEEKHGVVSRNAEQPCLPGCWDTLIHQQAANIQMQMTGVKVF